MLTGRASCPPVLACAALRERKDRRTFSSMGSSATPNRSTFHVTGVTSLARQSHWNSVIYVIMQPLAPDRFSSACSHVAAASGEKAELLS